LLRASRTGDPPSAFEVTTKNALFATGLMIAVVAEGMNPKKQFSDLCYFWA
jgi:hypothetical protein